MQTDILFKSLLEIGLSDYSANVYLEILADQKISITKIAQNLHTNRVKIYECLEELRVVGLMEKDSLIIEPPSRIVAILRHKEVQTKRLSDDLSEILPSYLGDYYSKSKKSRVKIYEGKNEFIKLQNQSIDELKDDGEILIFSEGMEMYDVIDPYYYNIELSSRRKNKNKTARIIASYDNEILVSKANRNEQLDRQVKILPKGFSSLGTIAIYDDRIINWNTVIPRAIMIEDEIMAKVYRDIFNFFWERL
jgi:predicted transcriptional regulator